MPERVVSVALRAKVDGFVSGMKVARKSVDDLTKAAAPSKNDAFSSLANKAAIAGVGIATAVGVAVKRFADFDQAMSAVRANSGSTGAELDALRAAAIKLGADSQFSATEAAQGINELSKAGVAAGDILGGGLKGSLDLAAAGQISVADAAETAATAMTQFKLSGSQVPHIADLLANAANKAQGGVGEMGQALKQAGLVAASTGLTIEETTAGLTAFASAGLIGSDAGTSFKTMLQRLSNPTKEAKAAMDDIGLSAYDANGNFVGLASVAGQLKDGLSKLTPEQRAAAQATIFGSDAVRASNVLYEQGAEGINKWTAAVSEQGAAAKQAALLTDNLKGDVERFGGALDSVFIQTGSGANGGLRTLVQGLTGLAEQLGKIPGPVLLASGALASFALLAPKGVIKYREYKSELNSLGLSMDKISTKAPKTAKALGTVGQVAKGIALAATAIAVLGRNLDSLHPEQLQQQLTGAADSTKALDDAINGLNKSGFGNGATNVRSFGDVLRYTFDPSFLDGAAHSVEGVLGIFGVTQTNDISIAADRLKEVDTTLASLVSSGNADGAAKLFGELTKQAAEQGVTVDQLKAKFPAYAEAIAGVANAASGAATGQGQLADGVGEVETSAEDAKAALDDYVKGLQNAGLVVLGTREAQRGLKQAIADATASIKENGRTLDINTQKGRDNQSALDDVASSALDLAQAIYDQTGSEEAMRASLTKSRASLIKTYLQFDNNIGRARAYADSILKIPAKRNTTVEVTVLGKAALDALQTKLYNIRDKRVTLTVGTVRVGNSSVNAGQFADGGYTGDGAKYEPAGIVHRGEYVITKAATAAIGKSTLDYLNSRGRLPGYANGGEVGRFAPARLMPQRSAAVSTGGNRFEFNAYGNDAEAATRKLMREWEFKAVSRL